MPGVMPLQLTPPLTLQLGILATRVDSGRPQRVRVRVQDGRTIEGIANTASPDHVSLLVDPAEQLVQIPAGDIARLEVARHHPVAIALGVAAAALCMATPLALLKLGVPSLLAYLGILPVSFAVAPVLRPVSARLRRWRVVYGS
jgi:hypothetical protein